MNPFIERDLNSLLEGKAPPSRPDINHYHGLLFQLCWKMNSMTDENRQKIAVHTIKSFTDEGRSDFAEIAKKYFQRFKLDIR